MAQEKVTAKALASELEMTPKKLRRKLRALVADGKVQHQKAASWDMTRDEADEILALVAATEVEEAEED